MANVEHDGTERSPERRAALRWLIRGFLSLWGLGAAALGIAFFKAPEAERRPSEGLVRCGPFSSLAVGEARFVRHGAEPMFVVRASQTEVEALSAVCTHLRCVLKWDQAGGTFLCPCHAGAFDRNGNVLSGPPNRPLRRYPVEVRADEIIVHT
ncbi:MAG TPA: Rieske (2Fe-2S) protein [Candidatus Polarisedimenticolia bacterium]|nr:Rieske (2Fe-2S) protein [Candidatus Polarisedimenticolia bacterium]